MFVKYSILSQLLHIIHYNFETMCWFIMKVKKNVWPARVHKSVILDASVRSNLLYSNLMSAIRISFKNLISICNDKSHSAKEKKNRGAKTQNVVSFARAIPSKSRISGRRSDRFRNIFKHFVCRVPSDRSPIGPFVAANLWFIEICP